MLGFRSFFSGSMTHTLRAAVGEVRSETSFKRQKFRTQLCALLATGEDHWIGDKGPLVSGPHFDNSLQHDLR